MFMLKSEIGKRKGENRKRKGFRSIRSTRSIQITRSPRITRITQSPQTSPATPEFSVFRFDFSVRLSQRLYVVYNGIRAVQQVLAQFLEELLAGTGLYV